MRKLDIFFVVILIVSAVVCLVTCGAQEEPKKEETKVEVTTPSEEETAPKLFPVTLFDVPLEAELQLHIMDEAAYHGIEPSIIFAMAFYESSFNPDATNGGGYTQGLLQVQPRWHKKRMERLGCTNLLDPYQNVTVAVDYLAEQIDRYDGNVAKGIVAYNKGHYAGKITYYAKAVMEKAEEIKETAYVSYREVMEHE